MITNTIAAILFSSLLASPAPAANATKPAGKAFDSPKQAADALIAAVSSDDLAALRGIFGPSGEKIVASGDPVKDKNDRQAFEELARKKTDVRIDKAHSTRATLFVGPDDWPFPVPIVKTGAKWHFASPEGLHEILMRRIGGNELDAIQVCYGYVEAQLAYAAQAHDESRMHVYAQKILSTPGKQDGLAWFGADGKPAGPIAEGAAKAIEEGYTKKTDPFHGYFFKILKSQGPAARHGELDYVIQGKMLGGFALVAWPARYRETGVKTFIISHNAILYEKDLGPDTAKVAGAMTAFNPDKTWKSITETVQASQ